MDAAEWARDNEPKRTRRGCIFCRLGEQATKDLMFFRDERARGKRWTLSKILPYFEQQYGYQGTTHNIRDHLILCLGERWTG